MISIKTGKHLYNMFINDFKKSYESQDLVFNYISVYVKFSHPELSKKN
jgi:hypothetical protein